MTNWTFVGAGNMASSLIGGLLNNGARTSDLSVVDTSADARNAMQSRFGVTAYEDIAQTPNGNGVVIAVKPQIVEPVCRAMQALNPPLVVSVAAGVSAESMQAWLPDKTAIVRCMPNTPALLGLGATALYANTNCSTEQKQSATNLLSTAGATAWVNEESALDAITALSGSGPAYFFLLIEKMSEAAQALGLSEELSQQFAIQTAFGAASMAKQGEHAPATLRENVTSKGGTTAAALAKFESEGFGDIVKQAMQAAHDRAQALGKEFGSS